MPFVDYILALRAARRVAGVRHWPQLSVAVLPRRPLVSFSSPQSLRAQKEKEKEKEEAVAVTCAELAVASAHSFRSQIACIEHHVFACPIEKKNTTTSIRIHLEL